MNMINNLPTEARDPKPVVTPADEIQQRADEFYETDLGSYLMKASREGNSFAVSLRENLEGWGKLSEKQLAALQRMKERDDTPKEDLLLSSIVVLFAKARQHIQYPKIRLRTESGNKVVLSMAGSRSRNPGTINITDGGSFGDNIWYGSISLDGQFKGSRSADAEVKSLLKALAKDPAAVTAVQGRRIGACCYCAKELTDARSLEAGYGPICADHFGLPWGE